MPDITILSSGTRSTTRDHCRYQPTLLDTLIPFSMPGQYGFVENRVITAMDMPEFISVLPELTDSSWDKVLKPTADGNAERETLEFMGDSFLKTTLTFEICERYPQETEHFYHVCSGLSTLVEPNLLLTDYLPTMPDHDIRSSLQSRVLPLYAQIWCQSPRWKAQEFIL